MSTSKIKVGDRVAFYNNGVRKIGVVQALLSREGEVYIRANQANGSDPYYVCHPKQCRILKTKHKNRTPDVIITDFRLVEGFGDGEYKTLRFHALEMHDLRKFEGRKGILTFTVLE